MRLTPMIIALLLTTPVAGQDAPPPPTGPYQSTRLAPALSVAAPQPSPAMIPQMMPGMMRGMLPPLGYNPGAAAAPPAPARAPGAPPFQPMINPQFVNPMYRNMPMARGGMPPGYGDPNVWAPYQGGGYRQPYGPGYGYRYPPQYPPYPQPMPRGNGS